MITKKEHWNYQYEPQKPSEPHVESITTKSVERELHTSSYEIDFSEMDRIVRGYVIDEGTTDHEFFVTREDVGKRGDTEWELQFKVKFLAPMVQSEIDAATARNNNRKKQYDQALSVYALQMEDWKKTKKEMEDISRAQRKTQYELLKKEFGQ